MKSILKKIISRVLQHFNLKVISIGVTGVRGLDLADDLAQLITLPSPVCLDIGANQGQTIELFQDCFNTPRILALEPASLTFDSLVSQYAGVEGISLFKLAAGAKAGRASFNKLPNDQLSSLLEPKFFPWTDDPEQYNGTQEEVVVTCIDDFLMAQNISEVDILKSDAQGFDIQVLRGADRVLCEGRVKHVLIEINFFEMYQEQGSPLEIFSFLDSRGYHLVDLYEKARKPIHDGTLSWCTALFSRRREHVHRG